jgi:hypothetical protein
MSSIRMLRDAQSKAVKIIQDAALMGEPTLSHDELSNVDDAVRLFGDAIEILAEHKRQAKARRDRIQWVYATERTMVAMYKGKTYRYSGAERKVDVLGKWGWIEAADASSIESASRKIRKAAKAK